MILLCLSYQIYQSHICLFLYVSILYLNAVSPHVACTFEKQWQQQSDWKRDYLCCCHCQTLCGCLWVCHRWKVGFSRLMTWWIDPLEPQTALFPGVFKELAWWLLVVDHGFFVAWCNSKIYIYMSMFISNKTWTWNASRGIKIAQSKQDKQQKGNNMPNTTRGLLPTIVCFPLRVGKDLPFSWVETSDSNLYQPSL